MKVGGFFVLLMRDFVARITMSTRKTPAKPSRSNAASPAVRHSKNRSMLTRPLGLLGWERLEPVLLAALTTRDPLLLIGRHGTAKSFLLERLAQALGLEYRFYNASLINYDDLVGIPLPDETQTSLRYITTPTAIWDAEVVFVDEINRTRPDSPEQAVSDHPRAARAGRGTREAALSLGRHEPSR